MDAFFNHQGIATDALGASLNDILSDTNTQNDDHLSLIRTGFNQVKAKLYRLG